VLAIGNVFAHHRRGDSTPSTRPGSALQDAEIGQSPHAENDDWVQRRVIPVYQVLYYAAQVNVKGQLAYKTIEASRCCRLFAPALS
jgi:hypothetical protein